MKLRKYQYAIFVFCFIIIVCRMVNVSVYDNSRGRNQIFGDGFSDINTISSAKYFLDSSFTQTAFLPVHDYYPVVAGKMPIVYTHYPALPNILAGVYATIFRTANESILRIIPVLLAMFFFFLIYNIMRKVVKDEMKAFIGASVLVLSNYFIAWADNLHQHLYGELLKWIYFYVLYLYYEGGRKNWKLFLGLLLILVLEVNISFEQPVYLGVLTLGFSIIYERKIISRETVFGVIAILFGFGLHVFQNVLFFGSWDKALADLQQAFLYRTAGVEGEGQMVEATFSWKNNFWEIPFNWFNRMERFYMFPGWFVLLIAYFGLKKMRAENHRLYQITWCVFFASIAWSFVMAQHAFIHTFTDKHFAVWYALVCSYSILVYVQKIKEDLASKNYKWYGVHIVLVGYAVVMFLSQQVYEVYLKFGIFYPALGN